MSIDFHTHTFPPSIAAKTLEALSRSSGTAYHTDGTSDGLAESMNRAGISYSVNLPVATSDKQVSSLNSHIICDFEKSKKRRIIPFGAMHPYFDDYRRELKRIAAAGLPGIKLHPAYQQTPINHIRNMRIIYHASELGLIVTVHAGLDIGLYEENLAGVMQILEVLKEVAPKKLVLAHMGGWNCWDQVELYLAGAPVFLDSSFSIGPVTLNKAVEQNPYSSVVMPDEQFLRIARKHGMSRILFATDSPWQDQSIYVKRFKNIGLTEAEQAMFFTENASKLLSL